MLHLLGLDHKRLTYSFQDLGQLSKGGGIKLPRSPSISLARRSPAIF
jgi:hypothetical protein